MENYLEKIQTNNRITSYRVTEKTKELEFDDNIEPLKAQMTPTHKRE